MFQVPRNRQSLFLYTTATGEKGIKKNPGICKLPPFKEKMIAETIPQLEASIRAGEEFVKNMK